MLQTAALILAAGKGTRMHSDKPKVLQTVLGEPMLRYVLEAVRPVFDGRVLVVVGHQAGMVEAAFPDAAFVRQEQQLGTGHALMQAMPALEGQCERVLVVNGDTPLLSEDVVRHFVEASAGADLAFATIELDDPAAYGRVVRAAGGGVRAIVEAKDYDPALYGPEPHEVNAGMYCVRLDLAARLLPRIGNANKSGEYYITDLISLAVAEGCKVQGVQCGRDESLMGVNSPLELSRSEECLRGRVVDGLLRSGVMLHAPALVRISPLDTVEPGAEITGPCEIYGAAWCAGAPASTPIACCAIPSSKPGRRSAPSAILRMPMWARPPWWAPMPACGPAPYWKRPRMWATSWSSKNPAWARAPRPTT